MPDIDGFEVCRRLKRDVSTLEIPVIFLTASSLPENERKGLELGAVDYITKPFNSHIVRNRIRNQIRYVRQRKLLDQLAQITALTEVANRQAFDTALDRHWKQAGKTGLPISLAVVDIDYFRQFNEDLGFAESEQALLKVAQTIASRIDAAENLVARYAGDVFLIPLPDIDETDARQTAERLMEDVRRLQPGFGVGGRLSVTVGGVTMTAVLDRDQPELLKTALDRLAFAKSAGRDRVGWSVIGELARSKRVQPG